MTTKATEKRKLESSMLDKLSHQHGYLIADTLPSGEQSTITATRVGTKMVMGSGIAVKLMVPHDSSLGRAIRKMRKEKAKARKHRNLLEKLR